MNAGNEKRSQNHFRLHFTSKTPYSFDARGNLSTPACDISSWTTENNQKQSHKKDQIDILTKN